MDEQKKGVEMQKDNPTTVPQVNPVARRIQTEEGWRRTQIKSRHARQVKS